MCWSRSRVKRSPHKSAFYYQFTLKPSRLDRQHIINIRWAKPNVRLFMMWNKIGKSTVIYSVTMRRKCSRKIGFKLYHEIGYSHVHCVQAERTCVVALLNTIRHLVVEAVKWKWIIVERGCEWNMAHTTKTWLVAWFRKLKHPPLC